MKILLLILLFFSPCAAETSWTEVTKGYEFNWPRDHGSHPNYETEWWYFTGHLDEEYGFELTFFRVNKEPFILIGHFALTDGENKKFYHDEVISRELKGVASASIEQMDVFLRGWYAKMIGNKLSLFAKTNEVSLKVNLTPAKNIILHGDNGVSVKGPGYGQASLYSSFTRLVGEAELSINGKNRNFSKAQVWYDHEVTSGELFEEFVGWDWFALQLEDGTDIMLYQLRDKAGRKTEYSSGTFVNPDGSYQPITHEQFTIKALDWWKSPKTGSKYPVKWELSLPKHDLKLIVLPIMKEQEMVTYGSTGRNYWEGKSKVTGSKRGQAYVELTGY